MTLAKYHKLKFGTDPSNELGKPPDLEPEPPELQAAAGSDEPISSQTGRQLLRQYLQEIGYTDTIIDVRSNRVRSLLGLEAPEQQQAQQENGGSLLRIKDLLQNSRDVSPKGFYSFDDDALSNHINNMSLAEAMMMEAESAVMANFDFLQAGMDVDDDDDMADDLDDVDDDINNPSGIADEVDAETEEVLNEFSFLGAEEASLQIRRRMELLGARADDVSLGELAQLTVNNDADMNMDNASLDVEPLYTFRQHSGPVMCLVMSTSGEHVYSASLDGTINAWKVPDINIDPYDSYVRNHTCCHVLLMDCKTVGPTSKTPLLDTFTSTSAIHMAVAYNSQVVIFDLESKKQIVRFECDSIGGSDRSPYPFWDNSTGKMLHAMVAHLDAVTSLAWILMDFIYYLGKMTAHRKKFDEAIHDVAFHLPNLSLHLPGRWSS
ncbi:Striatin-3 [Orchesella cincta]|uniref:Striatin-3 n=1 Tax=Orchesella cincta TaxID=48709 RepID=A0A1D2MNY8_ORCCI|nr:Striatin-3 [Orchesella cincta]